MWSHFCRRGDGGDGGGIGYGGDGNGGGNTVHISIIIRYIV